MKTTDFCLEETCPAGSSLYYSLLPTSAAQKTALAALTGWYRQLKQVRLNCQDPGVARLKFTWWLSEVERLQNNTAEHPLTQHLATTTVDPAALNQITQSLLQQLDIDSYPDEDSFFTACDNTIGSYLKLMLQLNGCDTIPEVYSKQCGRQLAIIDAIINFKQHRSQSLLPLPQNWLNKLDDEPLSDTLVQLSQKAHTLTPNLSQLSPMQRHCATPLIILSALKRKQLQRTAENGFQVLTEFVKLTPMSKLLTSWRVRWQERHYV